MGRSLSSPRNIDAFTSYLSAALSATTSLQLQVSNGRRRATKRAAGAALLCAFTLGGCAAKQMAEEFTPGADALFREFLSCQTGVFSYVAANQATYQHFGALKPVRTQGLWFGAMPAGDSRARVYRFDKPIKIGGLSAVAAGYEFRKGDGKGYSGGDATYWGFYFAESPEDVFLGLRDRYTEVAHMKIVSGTYVNMKVHQLDGDQRYDQGSMIEADSTQRGAKSFFNCSIQYVIPGQT
jgi:hypothetical protein